MNPLDNYIQEGILNRKNSISGALAIEELKRYSFDNLGPAEKNESPWPENGVWWDERLGGICVDEKKSTLNISEIESELPPPFNIVAINLYDLSITDNNITTTNGIFAPDCKVKQLKFLRVLWNDNLIKLENLPQKVFRFDYALGIAAQQIDDIDEIFRGMPRYCDKIEIDMDDSVIVREFFKDKNILKSNSRLDDPRHEFDRMIYEKIEEMLDPNCPAAKNRGNISLYYNR